MRQHFNPGPDPGSKHHHAFLTVEPLHIFSALPPIRLLEREKASLNPARLSTHRKSSVLCFSLRRNKSRKTVKLTPVIGTQSPYRRDMQTSNPSKNEPNRPHISSDTINVKEQAETIFTRCALTCPARPASTALLLSASPNRLTQLRVPAPPQRRR